MILSATLGLSQSVKRNQRVLLKEFRSSGDLGFIRWQIGSVHRVPHWTPLGAKKILEDASSAVGKALRHQMMRKLHWNKLSKLESNTVDLTFVGLSRKLAEKDLQQAGKIHSGGIADSEKIGVCIRNFTTLFHQKG